MGKAERGKEDNSDVVQSCIGNFGRWQLWLCLWISVLKFPVAWHSLGIVFLAPPVDSWCRRPTALQNLTDEQWRNMSQPSAASGTQDRDSCRMYDVNYTAEPYNRPPSNHSTVACVDWEYDRSVFRETIVTQWDLVCDRRQLANVAQTVFMFGILVGNVLFGMVADRFGRKEPLVVACVMQAVFGSACAFIPWFEGFLVMRFLTAAAVGGSMVTSFVICMEILGGWWRMAFSVLFHLPFSVGHATLPAIAYFAKDWHIFQLAISLPSILSLVYWWVIPESPRWLLAVGRDDKAIEILDRAARINKLDTSTLAQRIQSISIHKNKTKDVENMKKANILDLFRTPNMRLKTVCMYFIWVVCGLCFYGLSQYMGQIGGNIFINVAISGLISLPGMSSCIYLMGRFGRKRTILSSLMLAAVSCLLIMAVPQTPEWPKATLAALGIFGMSVAFPTAYLYAAELFPTVVRNVGLGSSSMCARFGSMVAPYVTSLTTFGFFVPPLTFGVAPLVGTLLCLFLPETANTKLPDTLEEGESFGKKINKTKTTTGSSNKGFIDEDSPVKPY
ncbi:Organic cation transporter protein [Cryptotermes secundus]|uniref:Organic cation transporter protein n=2 Tax=Cryptotermes secundus TaxID=105785 RepID=A0A2J7RBY0_9NEOP|nr:organic cation transporter protein isoform X1 [Cryptotermes secundus]XP_023702989.1 organic cation transporter protein isoform X2 [Cryptotermes secundus]PNF38331.1 Organic cation transporter protein [Cryptotermes secundus]